MTQRPKPSAAAHVPDGNVLYALNHPCPARFWPDALAYDQVRWVGMMGHRQVTDAYLAGLARHHGGRLASLDRGLVALHPDVGVAVA